jgi:hypothetical protein
MRNVFYILSTLLLLGSCKEDITEGVNLDTDLGISVFNREGMDLLDPQNPESYKEEEIKIYYLIDGVKVEQRDPMMDNPRSFSLDKNDEKTLLLLYPNYTASEEFPVTFIQWNEADTDTLKCGYARSGKSSVVLTKVWYNGKLMWDVESGKNGRWIEVVK